MLSKNFLKIGDLVIHQEHLISVELNCTNLLGGGPYHEITTAAMSDQSSRTYTFPSDTPEGKAVEAYFTNHSLDVIALHQDLLAT